MTFGDKTAIKDITTSSDGVSDDKSIELYNELKNKFKINVEKKKVFSYSLRKEKRFNEYTDLLGIQSRKLYKILLSDGLEHYFESKHFAFRALLIDLVKNKKIRIVRTSTEAYEYKDAQGVVTMLSSKEKFEELRQAARRTHV